MLTLYVRRGCFICDHAIHAIYRASRPFNLHHVGEDVSVEQVIVDFPAFTDEHHIDGIALPIVLLDGLVVGGYNELIAHLAGC